MTRMYPRVMFALAVLFVLVHGAALAQDISAINRRLGRGINLGQQLQASLLIPFTIPFNSNACLLVIPPDHRMEIPNSFAYAKIPSISAKVRTPISFATFG